MMIKTRYPQRGAMLITMSLFFITLIGFAAVAVDVGHLMIARNELQNAADAAALAGANCLNKTPTSSGLDCTSTPLTSSNLNWSVAGVKAFNSIGLNKADGATLGAGVTQLDSVTTGYKDVMAPLGSTSPLTPSTLSPVTCDIVVGPCYKPAVRVQLSKTGTQNGGPVQTLITAMFGGAAVPITATAVAVISSPGSVTPGNVIPYVINKCMFDLYWDSTTNSPKLYTGTPADPYGESTIGQPWEVRIGSSYHYGTCGSGQWTSFQSGASDIPTVRDLVTTDNLQPLSIGTNTYVQPGTEATLYNSLSAQYPTPPGADVTVPVVDQSSGLSAGFTPIVAFAGFHIDFVKGAGSGDKFYVRGHFIKDAITSGSSGVGPSYGTYTPPRLAQ